MKKIYCKYYFGLINANISQSSDEVPREVLGQETEPVSGAKKQSIFVGTGMVAGSLLTI